MDVEIKEYLGEAYSPVVSFESWRVAVINYADRLKKENLTKLERHLLTDEVFILIKGRASLYVGVEKKEYPLELGKIYNVKQGIYHAISLEENAQVVVVENDNTGDDNSEKILGKLF